MGELGTLKGGISSLKKEKYGKGIFFVNYMDVFQNYFIDDDIELKLYAATTREYERYQLSYGDVLFTASSEKINEICLSSVFLSNHKAIFNGFSKRYRFNQKILLPKYASYFFRSKKFRNQAISLATGYTRYNISQKDMLKIKLSIPELKIQKKIIDIIEPVEKLYLKFSKCVRIDNFYNANKDITDLIDIIEPLEVMLKYINHLKITLESFIANLPRNHDFFYLRQATTTIRNNRKNLKQVSAKALTKRSCFIQNWEKENTYKTNSFFCPKNTLLINSIRTYLEKFAILSKNADVNGTVFQFEVHKNYISIIHNLLNNQFWKQCNQYAEGTKMPKISRNNLLNNIKFFSVEKQFETIDFVSAFTNLNNLEIKINELLNKLIRLVIK